MPSNPLTEIELMELVKIAARKGLPVLLPPGYVLASPHDQYGPAAWRKLDAGHISTGIIDPDRLGTGSDGSGDLILHDDGTWRPAGGCVTLDFGLRSDPTVQYDNGNRVGGVYLDFCNRL
jgi:hypothetical protein